MYRHKIHVFAAQEVNQPMAHKTLYVSPADESLWAAAQRVADKAGTSVSRIVTDLLKSELSRVDAELSNRPADEWAHIAADVA